MRFLFDGDLPVCEKDHKGMHFFERIGIKEIGIMGLSGIVHQCSQCRKCVYELIENV